MRFIYATGLPCRREFAISETRHAIPPDAIVCAVCHPNRSIRNLDDWLLGAMTNREFLRLAKAIRAALRLETNPKPHSA